MAQSKVAGVTGHGPSIQRFFALGLLIPTIACGTPTADILTAYVHEADKIDGLLPAAPVVGAGRAQSSLGAFCDGPVDRDNRTNITQVTVQFATTVIGGDVLLPDIDHQTWSYHQWECFTDGVRTDGDIVVTVTHLEAGGWSLGYSGAMYVSNSDICSLEATATADEGGTITSGFSGTFCDEPLDGQPLMVPDFAP